MRYSSPLIAGHLLRRYQRFFADVKLADGRVVTAHCPNTGRMLGCSTPGSAVFVSPAAGPGRKLAFTLELVRVGRLLVGVNPQRANAIVAEALRTGRIGALGRFLELSREVTVGSSRLDLCLRGRRGTPRYVEVKSVTLAERGVALFPDAVSLRAAKHLRALRSLRAAGAGAAVVFLVQRGDCTAFAPAQAIDPAYGTLLREAVREGVQAVAYAARVRRTGIVVAGRLPVVLD